jgi:demethylmenaquinone methyltransferase/2-methoxy-6-polyprenyl-1,4-benzoquinol methylase
MAKTELDRVEQAYRRFGSRWAWNMLSLAGFQGFESSLRRRTVEHLELRPGDTALDVACGRGSNFPYLQRAVGAEGRILGVDYSPEMLAGAGERVRKHRWSNVDLVRGDAARMTYRAEFDGALCTISLSVIPEWRETLRAMTAAVRPDKRVAIMDGKPLTGVRRVGTLYARLFARFVAAELNRDVAGACLDLLTDVREESGIMFGFYFIMSGIPRSHV